MSLAKDLSARAVDRTPDALTFFQYPNFKPDKLDNLRQMAILSAPDLALLRAEAGAIIKVTDALLSDNVCSYRLNRSTIRGVAWGFETTIFLKEIAPNNTHRWVMRFHRSSHSNSLRSFGRCWKVHLSSQELVLLQR